MKKITMFFVAIFTFIAGYSQSFTISYVNGYKILQGERPEINVRDFPVDAYQQGKIKIKIDRAYEMQLPDVKYYAGSEDFVRTSISRLDNVNEQFQAKSYTPLFGMLYETNSKASNFRERHRAWGFHLWFTIELNENTSIADAVEAYQALPFVEIAEPFYNTVLHDADNITKCSSNDPRLNEQWHYNNTGQQSGTPGSDVSLFAAWEIEKGYEQVIVAVMDEGIQANHPDLEANMWPGIGWNFYYNSPNIMPGDHGCHTGGTISAVTNNGTGVAGVAGGSGSGDGVRLMSCQVFSPNGGGFENSYPYAADNDACISQNSWNYTGAYAYDQSVLNAIDYFIANGGGEVMSEGIVIFSAGNNGVNNVYYPGYYAPVLAVVATTNTDKKAYYSNYATWINIAAPGGETISVTARGVLSCIRTSQGSYGFMQGTSMACPHVSGTAALLVSYAARQNHILSRQDVWDLLTNNSDNIDGVNPSYIGLLGAGRLNAQKALLALEDMIAETGVKNPDNIIALPTSNSEIELSWLNNNNNNPVMILANATNEFGVPEDNTEYQVGEMFSEGGEVLYSGDVETFIHSGLTSATTYYYKFFSYNEDYRYSVGVESQATTLCGKVDYISEDFEEEIDHCWEQEYVEGTSPWKVGRGNNGNFPNHAFEGEYNIFLKMNDLEEMGNITRLVLPPIDMTGFDNVKLYFALHNQARSGTTDELSIYYRTSSSKNWNLWKVYAENQDTWIFDSIALSETVDTEELQICFQGKINNGRGICLDNIFVEGFIGLGVKENNLSRKILVYPNPTTGELTIENGELRIENVEVYNIVGQKQKLIFNFQFSTFNSIDISHLPSGIYFLKIGSETVKVVKE